MISAVVRKAVRATASRGSSILSENSGNEARSWSKTTAIMDTTAAAVKLPLRESSTTITR